MNAAPAKLDLLAACVLRPSLWTDDAARWVGKIPRDTPGDFVAYLQDLVNRGDAELFQLVTPSGPEPVGFIVATVEDGEFVVLAAAGSDGRDLTAAFVPQFEALGRARGCHSVRYHTMRPGLVEKSLRLGFRVSEIILRKAL